MTDMSKRNAIPPPHFPASTGEAVIHYADHDGRAVIGEGDTSFETSWSRSSSQDIYVLNDPLGVRGVAIAPDACSVGAVTETIAAGLNYTSRHRSPREGQIVVFENTAGRFLAAEVVDVRSEGHGDGEDRLVLRYAVVPTDEDAAQRAEIVRMARATEMELRRLQPGDASPPSAHGGIGHNDPPEPTPLTTVEFDEAISVLQEVRQDVSREGADRTVFTRHILHLRNVVSKIVRWAARKCDLAADAFAQQVGKTLADGKFLIAAWVALSGRLDQLVAVLGLLPGS